MILNIIKGPQARAEMMQILFREFQVKTPASKILGIEIKQIM
jgi:hypothetical protein